MFRQEYRTAVLIWFDRLLISTYLSGFVHDLRLIHGDQRTHHRSCHRSVCDHQGLCRLTGYLPQVFSCYEHHTAALLGNLFSYTHHKTAYQYGRLLFRAVCNDLFLYREQVYHMHFKSPAVGCQYRRQFFYFLPGSGACIRIRMEMHRFYQHSSFGHHPCGDRAVDPSGKKHQTLSVSPQRKPSEAIDLTLIDICPV